MKNILLSLSLLLASPGFAAVAGLSIKNADIIYEQGAAKIIRGKAPANAKQIQELIDLGVTDFLIFKIDTKGEVLKEQKTLVEKGVSNEAITHLPFPWKDVTNFTEACTMTMQALHTLQSAALSGKTLYFHCTAGEDRTGYLAGLFGLWNGEYDNEVDALQNELCARGYEAGNPGKPYREVVLKIRETLTPTYLKMAKILMTAKAVGRDLQISDCYQEPQITVQPKMHYCSGSSK